MNRHISIKNQNTIHILLQKKESIARDERKQSAASHISPLISSTDIHAPLRKMEKELAQLVGMQKVKQMLKEIYAYVYINQKRKEMNLQAEKQVLHMMFKGNPGTGKTTIARLIGNLFREMKILSKGHLIEVERADLVGEYIGHTALKTRDLIRKAQGGILFIDEAYSLARGGEKDFGKEAIDSLVANMENKKHEFILILAGYADEMENFLTLNPGLRSRFPFILEFPDYTAGELMQIAQKICQQKQYILTKEASQKLEWHLRENLYLNEEIHFSNGRYIRNILERAIRKQALRLLAVKNLQADDLLYLHTQDIEWK
ncbi:MAG: AAA family ATPase [Bacillales bacterium]|nr:AAA family ATPase [Bacillales bacterium]